MTIDSSTERTQFGADGYELELEPGAPKTPYRPSYSPSPYGPEIKAVKLSKDEQKMVSHLAQEIIKTVHLSPSKAENLASELVKTRKWINQTDHSELKKSGIKLRKSQTGSRYTCVIKGDTAYIHIVDKTSNGGFKSVTGALRVDLKTAQLQKVVHKKIRENSVLSGEASIVAGKVEVRKQSMLSHPSIPQILEMYEYKSSSGSLRLSIYEVACEKTGEQIVKGGIYAFRKRARFFKDIANAVAYMHERQFVHNDLKLDNIMDLDGRGMLIDFGLMFRAGGISPISCQWTLPPERKGKSKTTPVTFKSDVFQFGLMLGQAFAPTGKDTVGNRDRNTFVPAVQQAVNDWNPVNRGEKRMKTLILECLSENPESRPSMQLIRTTLSQLARLKR